MPINGENFAFEDIQIRVNGVQMAEITEINYSDEREAEEQYGTGSMPIAIGMGNYKASGDLTLRRHQYDTLRALATAAGRKIYEMNPFEIIISCGGRVAGDDGFTEVNYSPLNVETLHNCVWIKRNMAGRQNDKGGTVKLDFICESINPG